MATDTPPSPDSPGWTRRLLDGIADGFCVMELITDEAGEVIDARLSDTNAAFGRLSGAEHADGRLVSDVFPGLEPHWFRRYGNAWRTGEPVHFIGRAASLEASYEVTLIRIGDRSERRLTCLFKDVTERVTGDRERERIARDLQELTAELSENDRRKTEFLATLAHELRNPLAPLHTGLELIGERAGDAHEVRRLRDVLARQVHQLTHLVDDLLDVSRISQGTIELKLERTSLGEIMDDAVASVRPLLEAANHVFELESRHGRLMLTLDPVRITQVIANLLNNAARYTPPGGRVRLAAAMEGDEAVIVVTDDGDGIDADGLGRIFEMFTRIRDGDPDRQGGLGIGLPLSRRLVELHGGTLRATSDGIGRGSRFEIRLPADVPAPAPDAGAPFAATPAHEPPGNARRVLLVDDNEDAAVTLAALLAERGHKTHVVHRGRAALDVLADHAPDVALLDIGLPDISGYSVAREIVKRAGRGPRPTLVALTGWGTDRDIERSRDAGFDHHLTKPVSAARLQALLDQLDSDARVDADDAD